MVKSEYIVNKVIYNEDDQMLLELRSIEHGNKLFVEVNENTIPAQLQLDVIKAYFDATEIPKQLLYSGDKVFKDAMYLYIDTSEQSELHAIVEFSEWDYTIQSFTRG